MKPWPLQAILSGWATSPTASFNILSLMIAMFRRYLQEVHLESVLENSVCEVWAFSLDNILTDWQSVGLGDATEKMCSVRNA